MKIRSILFAALLLSAPASAQDRQFKDGETLHLQPDMAYLLIRGSQPDHFGLFGRTAELNPLLIRVVSSEELQQANELLKADPNHWLAKIASNLVIMHAETPYARLQDTPVMVMAVRPATYVVAGITWDGGGSAACICMGTVKFEAKPGIITDLGTFLAVRDDQPTTIPELANVVTGKETYFDGRPYTAAIRQADMTTPIPQALNGLARVPADYRAARSFPNYTGAPLTRLTAMPGVLDYDKDGNVIDLKTSNGQAPAPAANTPSN